MCAYIYVVQSQMSDGYLTIQNLKKNLTYIRDLFIINNNTTSKYIQQALKLK